MFKLLPIAVAPLLFGLSPQQPAVAPAPPGIPAEAAHMVNPVKPTADSQARVRRMYGYDCAMCHGVTGDGKGDLVPDMKLTMKNYTSPAALKDFSDGELFYIIKNGQGQMPGDGGRGKPDDIWNMVILVRSFAKA